MTSDFDELFTVAAEAREGAIEDALAAFEMLEPTEGLGASVFWEELSRLCHEARWQTVHSNRQGDNPVSFRQLAYLHRTGEGTMRNTYHRWRRAQET